MNKWMKEWLNKKEEGTSLVVQWLRLCARNAGVPGSITGQGTGIPNTKEKEKKKEGKVLSDNWKSSSNVEGMMDVKNHHVAAIILVADLGRSHQWILRLVSKVWWGTGYWDSLGLSPYKTLLNYKWENDDITVEKLGSINLARWSWLTSSAMGQVDIGYLPMWFSKKSTSSVCLFVCLFVCFGGGGWVVLLPRMYGLSLDVRKHQTNPNQRY